MIVRNYVMNMNYIGMACSGGPDQFIMTVPIIYRTHQLGVAFIRTPTAEELMPAAADLRVLTYWVLRNMIY